MPEIDLVILDMMSTTVEDRGEVLAAFTTALAQAGVTVQAGHQAGVRWNIGVWSGAHARRDLAAAPHTGLLASIADLPALLSRA
jgi:hypothetical protein